MPSKENITTLLSHEAIRISLLLGSFHSSIQTRLTFSGSSSKACTLCCKSLDSMMLISPAIKKITSPMRVSLQDRMRYQKDHQNQRTERHQRDGKHNLEP